MKYFFKNNSLFILAIFLILIVYSPWFTNFNIISRGDLKARGDGWYQNFDNIYTWDDSDYGGINNFFGGRIIRYPLYHFYYQLNELGFDFNIIERIVWFLPFIIFSIIGIYYLLKYIFKDSKYILPAVCLFLLNNYIVFRASGGQVVFLITYALWPIIFLWLLKMLDSKQNVIKITYTISLILILSISGFHEFRITMLFVFLMMIFGVIYSIAIKKIKNLLYLLFVVLGLIILNLWWIIPILKFNYTISPDNQIQDFASLKTLSLLSRTTFYDALSFSIGYAMPFFTYTKNQLATFLIPIIPIITFGGIIVQSVSYKKFFKEKIIILSLIFSLGLIFFAKGVNWPLGTINFNFYQYVPLSSAYRLASKFLLPLSIFYVILYTYSIKYFLTKIKNKSVQILLIVLLILLPFFIIYPFFWGDDSFNKSPVGSTFNPKFSASYKNIEDYLTKTNSDYKITFLPSNIAYYFGNYKNNQYYSIYTQKIQSMSNIFEYYNLSRGFDDNMINFLSNINVKYIFTLPEDDLQWYWQKHKNFDHNLINIENLNIAYSDKNTKIYEIDNVSKEISINNEINCIDDIDNPANKILKNHIYLRSDNEICKTNNNIYIQSEKEDQAKLTFNKNNPTEYNIEYLNKNSVNSSLYIHFTQNYDNNWQLITNNKVYKPIETSYYTNLFVINHDDIDPSGKIKISYNGQDYLEKSYKIFIFIFWIFIFILIILIFYIKKKSRKI